jgi:hypothetical protein
MRCWHLQARSAARRAGLGHASCAPTTTTTTTTTACHAAPLATPPLPSMDTGRPGSLLAASGRRQQADSLASMPGWSMSSSLASQNPAKAWAKTTHGIHLRCMHRRMGARAPGLGHPPAGREGAGSGCALVAATLGRLLGARRARARWGGRLPACGGAGEALRTPTPAALTSGTRSPWLRCHAHASPRACGLDPMPLPSPRAPAAQRRVCGATARRALIAWPWVWIASTQFASSMTARGGPEGQRS